MCTTTAATIEERPNHHREGYESNKTVFGKILQGKLPATILYEDDRVICFKDIRPVSVHHTLVIPKQLIADSNWLQPDDLSLVRHMMTVAKRVLSASFPDLHVEAAYLDGTASLGFHRWPALSVAHLHLHCIYPMPCSTWWYRWLHPQRYGIFYVSADSIIKGLEAKQKGVETER